MLILYRQKRTNCNRSKPRTWMNQLRHVMLQTQHFEISVQRCSRIWMIFDALLIILLMRSSNRWRHSSQSQMTNKQLNGKDTRLRWMRKRKSLAMNWIAQRLTSTRKPNNLHRTATRIGQIFWRRWTLYAPRKNRKTRRLPTRLVRKCRN